MDTRSTRLSHQLAGFCSSCTVLSGKASLFLDSGAKARPSGGVYQQQVVVVDSAKKRPASPLYVCPGQLGPLGGFEGAGFLISGRDEAATYHTTPDAGFDSGYVVGEKGAEMAMYAEVVNLREEEQKVFVAVEYEYLRDEPGKERRAADTTTSLLSATGCEGPEYVVEEGRDVYNMTSPRVVVGVDGYIVNAK